MKIHFLIENESESAEREAVMDCHLYRGTDAQVDTTDMVRIPIRTDRRPRNTEHAAHVIFNAFFEMAHGVKDVRARTMFCSTSWLDASAYSSSPTSNGNGVTLRVYPLKTAKIAFIPGQRDSLDDIEGLGIRFTRSLKELFLKDDNMDRMSVVSKKAVYELNNGPVDNCLEQVNAALDAIRDVCTEEELPKVDAIVQLCIRTISTYQVVPASNITQALGGNDAELMVFDAPYFYAQIQPGDRFADIDDDGIPY